MHVTLKSDNGAEGSVDVLVRLIDRATGQAYAGSESLSLRGDRPVTASVEVNAPPGDYTPDVHVEYPQQ